MFTTEEKTTWSTTEISQANRKHFGGFWHHSCERNCFKAMYVKHRAKSVVRMKGCSNQLCLAPFTGVVEFLRHHATYCILWRVTYSSVAQVTIPHCWQCASNDRANETCARCSWGQQIGFFFGCRYSSAGERRGLQASVPCLKAPLEVVLPWGSGGDSRGVGLWGQVHGGIKQQLHHKECLD